MAKKPQLQIETISEWLDQKYDDLVCEFTPIRGGFWSSAYTYRIGEDDLVLRLSEMAEGFAIDTAAMQFTSPNLPIPEVLEVGEALDLHYAISRRHYGRFLEDISVDDAHAAGEALNKLLMALRAIPATPDDVVVWDNPAERAEIGWHDWLSRGLVDEPGTLVSGWRETLAEHPEYDAIFKACEARIESLLPHCPERRDLVHGDLLHQNVLISEDATKVTAIFSWKCSVRGDFLYDVAWCTVWSPWHAGIKAADMWSRTLSAPDLTAADLTDASLRHHCYELQIAASHFGWNVWTESWDDLAMLAERTQLILERGPLSENS